MILILLLISWSLFSATALSSNLPVEIEQTEDGNFILTPEQVVELAQYIERLETDILELQDRNQILLDRLEEEREAHDDLIASQEETIKLQDSQIENYQEQVEDLTTALDTREEQLELNREMLEIREEQKEVLERSQFYERVTAIGLSAVALAVLIR